MKKIFLLSLSLLFFSAIKAEDNSMLFTLTDGVQKSIPSDNLEIIFVDGNMVATSGSTVLSLPVTSIATMELTGDYNSNNPGENEGNENPDEAGIDSIGNTGIGKIDVISIAGNEYGRYESVTEAMETLQDGIYIFRFSDGSTIKIVVKK
ncbi:MAG: hypothetical protein J1F43_02510 [Muribaculaceae bacterium]|nr:hypothetical protein [Muribaculaceae bacterium]